MDRIGSEGGHDFVALMHVESENISAYWKINPIIVL